MIALNNLIVDLKSAGHLLVKADFENVGCKVLFETYDFCITDWVEIDLNSYVNDSSKVSHLPDCTE